LLVPTDGGELDIRQLAFPMRDAMDQFPEFWAATQLPIGTIAVRLVVAALLGAVIGIEREWRNRPAGLRTHMLTALAAALFTVLTTEILLSGLLAGDAAQPDPIRIIEAVTGGVAFLAAGAIIQNRDRVRGLTTGAGMWLAGALGVAAGLGLFVVGALAAALGLLIITLIGWIERAAQKPAD
jgi:putative Mg2+ transporter-C (MgtC) family protein